MKIRIAFSTCPNDTFAFYALVHHKIPTRDFTFDLRMGDIQDLNVWAQNQEADVIKVSSNALGLLHPNYYLLHSGAALGRGCGPLWICRPGESGAAQNGGLVAIPGEMTTANLLLHFRAPALSSRKQMLFSSILEAVEQGEVASGLLIHEQRFTYQSRKVELIEDLGDYWERKTGLPIPLGSIVASRQLELLKVREIESLITQSIQWAFDHPEETMPFVRAHAAELDESVMRAHIDLYVNHYSLNFGEAGAAALDALFPTGAAAGLYPPVPSVENIMASSPYSLQK